MLFAGTGVTKLQLDAPDFDLTPELLWQVCDNIQRFAGPGWYFDLPSVWTSDVHGDLEAAMRFAPTLRAAFVTAERFGSARWPVATWKITWDKRLFRIGAHRTVAVPPVHWQMLTAMFALNSETILAAAFPDVIPHVRHNMFGPPPRPLEQMTKVFRCPVVWESPANEMTIPRELLDMPSNMADSRQFHALIAALETRYGPTAEQWSVRASNALGDRQERQEGTRVAATLGVSFRTLERRLAEEGTSFRQLTEARAQAEFEALVKKTGLSLAAIVGRMGYSDESALSRATRRWYGVTATEARRRLVG